MVIIKMKIFLFLQACTWLLHDARIIVLNYICAMQCTESLSVFFTENAIKAKRLYGPCHYVMHLLLLACRYSSHRICCKKLCGIKCRRLRISLGIFKMCAGLVNNFHRLGHCDYGCSCGNWNDINYIQQLSW